PGDHAPGVATPRIDRQVPDGEALLFPGVLDVHLRDAVDDADAAVHAHRALARRDAAIVRLAGAQVRDVLGLRLEPGGRVHVREIVGQRRVERRPVLAAHGVEATVVGLKHFGFDGGRGGSGWTHGLPPWWERRDATTGDDTKTGTPLWSALHH